MPEPYREGHEYVVCPECKSHFELLPEFWVDAPAGDASFTCDNWECEADFVAPVLIGEAAHG